MIARLKFWAVTAALVVSAVLTSWFVGRKSAQTDAKLDQLDDHLTKALRAEEIEDEVDALGNDALRRRARKWVRPRSDE